MVGLTVSLGYKDWVYAMYFQLTSLPHFTQSVEVFGKLHATATESNDYGMMVSDGHSRPDL